MDARRFLHLIIVSTLAVAGVGCSQKDSSTGGDNGGPIATNQMYMNTYVVARDTITAEIESALTDGKLLFETTYRLSGGDNLQGCFGSQCKPLVRNALNSLLIPDAYSNQFTYQPNVDYVVSLSRPTGGNAPNSRVSLPPPFQLITPIDGQSVTDHQTVSVTWMPAAGPDVSVELDANVDCIRTDGSHFFVSSSLASQNKPDGSKTFAIDQLFESNSNSPVPTLRCDIEFTLIHERRGKLDPAFRGGFILGRVVRSARLNYVPIR